MPERHAQCIDDGVADNDELTAYDLKDMLVTTLGADNVQYGERTMGRIRNKLGWTYSTAKYCQAIQDTIKQKRLDWCTNLIATKEKFEDVIYVASVSDGCQCSRKGFTTIIQQGYNTRQLC